MSASEAKKLDYVLRTFVLLDERALSERSEAVFKEIAKDLKLTLNKEQELLKAAQPAFKDIQDNIKEQVKRLANSQGGLNKVPTWVSTKPVMAAAGVQVKQLVKLTCQDKGLREHSKELFADHVLAHPNSQSAKPMPQVSSPELTDVYMNAMQAYYYERVMTGIGFTQPQLKGFYGDNSNNWLVRFDHQHDQAILNSDNIMDGVILGMIVREKVREEAAETKAENRQYSAEQQQISLEQAGMANSENSPHLAKELLRNAIIEKIDDDIIAGVIKKYEPENSFKHTLVPSLSRESA